MIKVETQDGLGFILRDDHVLATKRSMFTGVVNTFRLDVNPSRFRTSLDRYNDGAFLQDAFSYLSADEREFIKTGITPTEWETTFGTIDSSNDV